MGHPVVHFAVYYDGEPDDIIRFYEALFGWRFEAWGPPGYFKIATEAELGATAGALSMRTSPRGEGAPNAYRCTIAVSDADTMMQQIEDHGGKRRSATADIPGVGAVAEFEDPAGNLACVMAYAPGSPFHLP